jgi:hypothetical protein
MKIPRWIMIGLTTFIVLTLVGAGVLCWHHRPGPDIAGWWSGYGWGRVDLRRVESGAYVGTYSSTYGQDIGRITVAWSPGTRQYQGTWGEGTYRFGHVAFWVERDGSVRGIYSADPDCTHQPGDPVRQEFQWSKGQASGPIAGGRW